MAKKVYTKPEISKEQLEQALYEANVKLEAVNQKLRDEETSRNELLSNLSHDLRSSISALVSGISCLQSGSFQDPEEYGHILDVMQKRLQTISRMTDDLFLLARMENPQTKLIREKIDAGIFLEEFFYSCREDSKFANRNLHLEVPEDLHCFITIDPVKILRVLDNLFTNALLYSENGADIFLGAVYSEEAGEDCLAVYVRDTGIGIAPENIPLIFHRSFRVNSSRTPEEGSGLGLAIAKSIVERHGGIIRCESVLGKGSCFSFTLPAEPYSLKQFP